MNRYWFLLLLPVVLALVPDRQVQGGDCGTLPYVAPVYAAPVSVPIIVPYALFQFVAPPSVQAPVAVAPNQMPAPVQQAAAPDAGLDRRLAAIEQALARLASPSVATPRDGPPVIRRKTIPDRQPREMPRAERPEENLTIQVAGILQGACAQCHTGPAGRGNITLFNSSAAFNPNVTRSEIDLSVAHDRMPKTPRKLSREDKSLVKRWAAQEKAD